MPVLVVLLAVAPSCMEVEVGTLLGELALGVPIWVVVPFLALRLERTRLFDLAEIYEPL